MLRIESLRCRSRDVAAADGADGVADRKPYLKFGMNAILGLDDGAELPSAATAAGAAPLFHQLDRTPAFMSRHAAGVGPPAARSSPRPDAKTPHAAAAASAAAYLQSLHFHPIINCSGGVISYSSNLTFFFFSKI